MGTWQQVSKAAQRLSIGQKLAMVALFLLVLLSVIFALHWAKRPDFTPLYTNLSPQDASRMVDKLRSAKIPYKLSSGGTAIMVPSKDVYQTRISLAAEGLPQASTVGFEIFDKTNLGTTDFVQKINYHRALEGELTRTIEQLAAVRSARVHLVIPNPNLFTEEEKEATASVVLTMAGGGMLGRGQVKGIAHLVASSVEGLKPENVTILDNWGNILSGGDGEDNSLFALTNTQLELQRNVESYLSHKAAAMLEKVVGAGNAIVKVNVELNFNNLEKTVESYDPESSVIRSEERNEQSSPAQGGKSESSVTNYEISKTVEHIVDKTGSIKRLWASVLINGSYKSQKGKKGKEIKVYQPRSEEEISKLTEIVKKAVGFDPSRGDQIEVANVKFGAPPQLTPVSAQGSPFGKLSSGMGRNLVIGFVLVVALLFLKLALKQLGAIASSLGEAPSSLPSKPEEGGEGEAPGDAKGEIIRMANERPDQLASLVRSWLTKG